MKLMFKELQRRNVLRVAAFYVVASWVILQAAELLFGLFALPAWSNRLVFALLLLGFPLVLILAWVYEITPEGIKRESEVDRSQSITNRTGNRLNTITAITAVLAIILILAQGFIPGLRPARDARDGQAKASTASIAVLPFANMSSDKEQDYFSDGLSEELLNLLARIPQLKVISRTSSFQFKGSQDVRAIADKLGVAHVLEGSVRKSGETVRISVKLINAADARQVWSNTYDRKVADIFAVQDEIAAEVVTALELSLLGGAPKVHTAQANPRAYTFYLQAQHYLNQRTSNGYTRSLAYLDSALMVDPNYALAWARKSSALTVMASSGDIPLEEGVTQARKTAERAMELDPQLSEPYAALARVETLEWDWVAAERHLSQAEALDPANQVSLNTKANLLGTLGRLSEAKVLFRRITEHDPLHVPGYLNLGLALMRTDSFATAATQLRRALDLSPEMGIVRANLGLILMFQGDAQSGLTEIQKEPDVFWRAFALPIAFHGLGRKAESDRALADLEQRYAVDGAYQIAEVYAYRGQRDLAFKWLDRAYVQRDPGLTQLIGDPLIKNITGDARYGALLRKLKLPES